MCGQTESTETQDKLYEHTVTFTVRSHEPGWLATVPELKMLSLHATNEDGETKAGVWYVPEDAEITTTPVVHPVPVGSILRRTDGGGTSVWVKTDKGWTGVDLESGSGYESSITDVDAREASDHTVIEA